MHKPTLIAILTASLFVHPISANDNTTDKAAEAAAKELANPNTTYASLNLKLQYNSGFASKGGSLTTIFQPVLPFPMENGDKVIFRPAISYVQNNLDKDAPSGIADIVFDLAYAPKTAAGTIVAFGVFASIPTGNSDLTADQFAIGPEIMFGKIDQNRIIGVFPNHLYGVSGDGADYANTRINKTSAQVFWVEFLPGGWTLGSAPTFSYDWHKDQAEIPLNLSITKTTVLGGRPWKIGIEANYYLEKDEKTRPDFMFGFNITPVVENKFTALFD